MVARDAKITESVYQEDINSLELKWVIYVIKGPLSLVLLFYLIQISAASAAL